MKKTILLILVLLSVTTFGQNNAASFDWSFNGGAGVNSTSRLNYNSQGDLLFLMEIWHQTIYGGTPISEPAFFGNPGITSFIGKRTQSGVSSVVVKVNSPNTTGTTFQDFVIDSNDNIIVAGTTFSTDLTQFYDFGNGITLYGKGNFIAKFNPQGVCLWANLINYNITNGNASENKNLGLGVLPNNDIYFANRSTNGAKPFWLIKYNTAGTEIWHKEWIITNSNSIAILTSKNNFFFDNTGKAYFYISSATGELVTADGITLTPPAGSHPSTVSLLTINNDGSNDLFTTYRGIISDIAVEKATGNVLFGWQQYGQNPAPFNTLPIDVAGGNSFSGIIALDPNRNLINYSSQFNSQNGTGSIFPVGNLNFISNARISPGGTLTIPNQTFTATKYTPTWRFYQNFTFSKFIAHPELNGNNSTSYNLMAIYNNKLAVSGTYRLVNNATIVVNGTTLISCGNDPNFATLYPNFVSQQGDVFISQLTIDPSFLAVNSLEILSNFTIYPNPASNNLNLKLENYIENASLKIISITGQVVFEKQNLSGTEFNFDVSNLNSGLYIVQIRDLDQKLNSKFIKQ